MEKEWKAYEIGELDQYLFGQGDLRFLIPISIREISAPRPVWRE